jgi:hypothetical protein
MLLSLVYFAVRRLLRAVAPTSRDDVARDVELLVLRHQVKVLARRVHQPVGKGSPWRLRRHPRASTNVAAVLSRRISLAGGCRGKAWRGNLRGLERTLGTRRS